MPNNICYLSFALRLNSCCWGKSRMKYLLVKQINDKISPHSFAMRVPFTLFFRTGVVVPDLPDLVRGILCVAPPDLLFNFR